MLIFGSLFPSHEWPPGKRDEFLAQVRIRKIRAGETLLREGQACGSIPFVISGSIRVFKTAESGREITLYRIKQGQSCILSIGCGSSLRAFPANVVAERATTAAFIPAANVRRLFAGSEAFRTYVLDQYSLRMADIVELVEEVAFKKVDERLFQFLAGTGAQNGSLVIKATHQELADHVGTSREVVSRILKDWEERKAIEISRGSIRLLAGFEKLGL
jgi:CRP/FNR family transcriptional regulator